MFLFTIFIIQFAHGMFGGGFGGGMMGPPIIPGTQYFECEGIPSMMCTLQRTMGKCVYLPTQKKCDLAEKCSGRSEQQCSLYWSGSYQMPNCVWLTTFGKCDESTKCQGRSKFLCTHPRFPGCHWQPMTQMMGMQMGGFCADSGFSLAEAHTQKSEPAETNTQKSEPTETKQLEKAEVVEPVLEATSTVVHSAPKESSPGVLIALASGSFFVGLLITTIILRCKQKRRTVEELDFNYTLEPDAVPRQI